MAHRRNWIGVPLVLCTILIAADNPSTYSNNFEKAELDKVPEELLVTAGTFAVRQEATNKFLELAGEPLESFGFLAGPEGATSAIAKIRGDVTGKRFPEFGIGLGGPAGLKLWLMPATKELQIIKGDDVVAKTPYAWTPATWTNFQIQIRKTADAKWVVTGKAWEQGKPEPADWMIKFEDTEAPPAGRASMWGTPYSGKPIAFDDITAK